MYKAIETFYNGYRFRSRLEARWAVFFDAYGIRYRYEDEGYYRDLGDEKINYLPDFYFPDYNLWGEVKGVIHRGQIPEKDAERMSWMIDFNGPCANGIVMLGEIPDPMNVNDIWWAIWYWTGKGLCWDYKLNHLDGEYFGFEDYQSAPHIFDDDIVVTHTSNDPDGGLDSKLYSALKAARSARFEHGETPNTRYKS